MTERKKKSRYRPYERRYLGIDGEGQGRDPHRYVMLAAADEELQFKRTVENASGLGTEECLNFLLDLNRKDAMCFAYSFQYDLTMMLSELDNESLYLLFRPELRQRRGKQAAWKGPHWVKWNGFRLNLQGSKFGVAHGERRRVVWDLFKFFQGKFVNAIRDWKVPYGTAEKFWDNMQRMKEQRGEFDKLETDEIRNYCFEECSCMAQLARVLYEAHCNVGLHLRNFYGAGSTGSAMLNVMGIKDKIRPAPDEMKHAVSCAFFGGRFENSHIGRIDGTVYNYDISSAYPYQLCYLPCLLHGEWSLTKRRADIENARTALVRYRLPASKLARGETPSWGPFPFRTEDGSISFPTESGGGWVYRDEFDQATKAFPNVEFHEAWILKQDCDCRPFAEVPRYYLERLRIGKEGPGIVLKLGLNSCYGKLAQSVGSAIFNSWLWAGMITSGTRAQMLELMALHKDRSNLLMIATDGAYTRERIDCPKPKDTGTDIDVVETSGRTVRKPLGGWEEKVINKGVFCARPGIYFPMNPTDKEIKDVRGRGLGKGVILENWRIIVDQWERQRNVDARVRVANVNRFCGAKTSVHMRANPENISKPYYVRAVGDTSSVSYGQWITREVEMTFHPMPKRASVRVDGSLELRSFPMSLESTPYDKAIRSKESTELARATEEVLEQPDGDLSDYVEAWAGM